MKNVRIMLSAIVVLAVVGGALAFKAKDDKFCYFVKAGPNATICPLVDVLLSYSSTGTGLATVIDIPATGCPDETATSICNKTFLTTTN